MPQITVEHAVTLIYHGRSNLMDAARLSGAEPRTLQEQLLEKIQQTPPEPLQLSLQLWDK